MDQLTHDVRRTNWLDIINQCQKRPDRVTVRKWLTDNGIGEKAYYYWLRKFRKETYEQLQAPAVSRQDTTISAEINFAEITIPSAVSQTAVPETARPTIIIRHKNLSIEISNSISPDLLVKVLQEVTHA